MRPRCAALLALALLVGGCSSLDEGAASTADGAAPAPAATPDAGGPVPLAPGAAPAEAGTPGGAVAGVEGATGGAGIEVAAPAPSPRRRPEIYRGSGRLIAQLTPAPAAPAEDGEITLNFVNADIREVVDAVLGDALKLSYVVDPKVQGTITVRSSRPLGATSVIPVLEEVLGMNGAALIKAGDTYKIVPLEQARAGVQVEPGFGIHVVPLTYASASALRSTIEPFVPPGRTVYVDAAHNILMFVGPAGEAKDLEDLVGVFDVDWMAGMSFAIHPLQSADAKTLAQELDQVFGQEFEGPLAGVVRFVPIERLNAILVITQQPAYLDKAAVWIERLDRGEDATEQRIYVYLVQNGRARDLAGILSDVFGASVSQGGLEAAGRLAPGLIPGQITRYGGGLGGGGYGFGGAFGGSPFGGGAFGGSSLGGSSLGGSSLGRTSPFGTGSFGMSRPRASLAPPAADPEPLSRTARSSAQLAQAATQAPPGRAEGEPAPPAPAAARAAPVASPGGGPQAEAPSPESGIRIVADERNNALVILATPAQYRMIQATLRQLDIVPLQVLIEATIAEVTLTDELKYGLEWFFESGRFSASLSQAAPSAINAVVPGFNFLYTAADARVVLSALTSVTDVRVISSPQLMVLDNQAARLQVGDQVPIATQSAIAVTDPEAPIVNTIEYRDTGVILDLVPHVNAGGLVTLDIIQEVSSVAKTVSSGIDSPTIQQRQIASSVAVQSGETVVLGGLIRDSTTSAASGVPLLADIPVLGNLFKSKDNTAERTELVVLLTPRAIRNSQDARSVTEELRRRLPALRPLESKIGAGGPPP